VTTTIRDTGVDDAELLHDLARQTFPLACPEDTTDEAIASFIAQHLSVESFREYLNDSARSILLGEVDGVPAGYVLICTEEPTDPDVVAALTARPTLELSKCYVLAGFHGAGVASALVEHVVLWARSNGFAGVWLGVNQQNTRANRFYDKMGFRRAGIKKFLVGDRWEDDFVRELIVAENCSKS